MTCFIRAGPLTFCCSNIPEASSRAESWASSQTQPDSKMAEHRILHFKKSVCAGYGGHACNPSTGEVEAGGL
jgi:hypothetical protein